MNVRHYSHLLWPMYNFFHNILFLLLFHQIKLFLFLTFLELMACFVDSNQFLLGDKSKYFELVVPSSLSMSSKIEINIMSFFLHI